MENKMATLETQYKNWLKENEPIEYSEWLEKFSEIHNLDKVAYPKIINEGVNEGVSDGVKK
jgi:hypothetical protein